MHLFGSTFEEPSTTSLEEGVTAAIREARQDLNSDDVLEDRDSPSENPLLAIPVL